jgi:hypothetical protein
VWVVTTAQWRTVTLVLAVIFLLVVALLVVIILGRIGDDGGTGSATTPTPTATASASASPTGAESSSPEASASASIEPSPSAAASPAATGAVPLARAVIRDLGIDRPEDPQARPRIFVFRSDGGGDVTVELLSVSSGRARICLYPGTLAAPLGEPACLRTAGSTLTGHSKGKKPFTWTVTLMGTNAGVTPMADVRIDWPATDPHLEIIDFRLQGNDAAPYNGVFVQLAGRPDAGPMTLAASWSDPVGGDVHPYKAAIEDRDTSTVLDSAEGEGTNVALGANLLAKQRTTVELRNPGPMVATEVLAALTLTWP